MSVLLVAAVAIFVSAVAFGGFVSRPHSANAAGQIEPAALPSPAIVDGVPEISSVSKILSQAAQKIVIRGRGFGMHVPYSHTDSPFLAIRDETADWAAGRMVPHNWDEVMLDVESWSDDQIVISGFSGAYGQKGWKLAAGDKLEVRVWNPQSGTGPARFSIAVTSGR